MYKVTVGALIGALSCLGQQSVSPNQLSNHLSDHEGTPFCPIIPNTQGSKHTQYDTLITNIQRDLNSWHETNAETHYSKLLIPDNPPKITASCDKVGNSKLIVSIPVKKLLTNSPSKKGQERPYKQQRGKIIPELEGFIKSLMHFSDLSIDFYLETV